MIRMPRPWLPDGSKSSESLRRRSRFRSWPHMLLVSANRDRAAVPTSEAMFDRVGDELVDQERQDRGLLRGHLDITGRDIERHRQTRGVSVPYASSAAWRAMTSTVVPPRRCSSLSRSWTAAIAWTRLIASRRWNAQGSPSL